MLTELEITNYRLFDHLKVEGLGRVNLITGENGVGKSALLQSLMFYFGRDIAHTLGFIINEQLVTQYSSAKQLSAPFDLSSKLLHDTKPLKMSYETYLTNIKIGDLEMSVELGYNYISIWEKGNERNRGNYSVPDIERNFDYLSRAINEKLPSQVKQIEFLLSNIKLQANANIRRWSDIALDKDKRPRIAKLLQEFDSRIEIFDYHHTDTTFKYTDKNNISWPTSTLSDGFLKYLSIMLTMLSSENGIVLIDEIENGLHYSIQPKLWEIIFKLAHELDVQVFATTHSKDTLEAFNAVANTNEHPNDGVLIRMMRTPEDKIIAKTLSEERVDISLATGTELRA